MSIKTETKFGTATLCSDGYYHISSRKEGNIGKKLSRLVFEDFYKIKLPTHIQIHHVDGDKTNDNIWNLIPLTASEHTTLHNIQDGCTEETKVSISKSKTTTGYFRVIKVKDDTCMIGFKWMYNYRENGKQISITATGLKELKNKVLTKGLDWLITDETLAEKTRKEAQQYYEDRLNKHSTGVVGVYKRKDKTCKQGFIWQYRGRNKDGKLVYRSSIDFDRLKKRVIAEGLDWVEL